ncbi:hypothetical protein PVAND_006448 [Polypedilum vanderplanki]|uniref:RNA-binding protein 5 n=1 Tax=Polypedilum vanderplanki TaxID=319348 RepID=A0A9J6C376_POLVA|nr:hypothetical protein PVAND_006448 [Polypedilum vanderplanki]
MNRNNYNNNPDEEDGYYRKRDKYNRDDGYHSRRRRSRSRSRSRDYRSSNNDEDSWSGSNRDDKYYDRRNRERNRDRRGEYERRDNSSHHHRSRHYESEESDSGSNHTNEPNNKVIVRGLAPQITEADIQCDLIQSGLKPLSIRLIRKKATGQSRGFAFVTFSSIGEARSWIEQKQGVLILQDQYKATIQYSFMKENEGHYDKVLTDWYCGKCGVFNFKRRDNCFKCNASREESGSEGFDEVSNILTKKIMFRNLDALTTEEKVLTVLQEKIPEFVSKISKILICRDQMTQVSRGICYLNFDNLVDSMNTFQALEKLQGFEIDGREVSMSYCVDSENRVISKPHNSSNGSRSNSHSNDANYAQNYQYTLADVPKLAEQAASIYAQNGSDKEAYIKYYTEYYTQQITSGNIPSYEAHSGASIAQSAIERKQKSKSDTTYGPLQQVEIPRGDGKKYPTPDVSQYQYDETSGYYYDTTTGLYYDASSQYYYNSEIAKYLYWDSLQSTYVLAPTEHTNLASANAVAAATSSASQVTSFSQQPPPPPAEEAKDNNKKQKEQPQDKVKVAKKIVKDMEKWAKQLNQKKDYTPIQVQNVMRNDNSQSPPLSKSEIVPDIGYSMLDRPMTSSAPINLQTTSAIAANKLVAQYHSDSDEHEDQAANKCAAAANSFNENDLLDYEKLVCLLCKRGFPSSDVLTKHSKMSNLHKENLQKYKLQNGILDIGSNSSGNNNSSQSYRDRAKERRQKYGEAEPLPPVNRAKERFQREMEKKASLVQSYQAQTIASRPIDDSNIGNKLLKAMGWKEGLGLGKSGQGRTEIIEAEQRISNAGLGSKSSSYGAAAGDDYKSYIKKMMKKRYEEVQ